MNVEIKNAEICLEGRKIPLLSGEIHFWRHQKKYWDDLLDAAVELGLPMIATYVCWEFHEQDQHTYDFTGETSPETDLVSFIKKVDERGLKLILRPGPYIYAEWTNLGVPDRVAHLHRLSDEFLAETKHYLSALINVVKPFLADNDGPIVLWQADNEIDMMPHYYTSELGLSHKTGEFQNFLTRKYKNIASLNKTWDCKLKRFEDARATTSYFNDTPLSHIKYYDFMQFRHDYNLRVAKKMTGLCQKLGVDIPIYLNSYPHQDSIDFKSFSDNCDLFGIDPYPSGNFRRKPDEFQRFIEKMVVLNSVSKINYIAEFEAGVWVGQHHYACPIPPNHYQLMCTAALAAGCKGWNWYMLANRDNWLHSPINERGNKRVEFFPIFKKIVSAFLKLNPAQLERITDHAVTFDLMQNALRAVPRNDAAKNILFQSNIPFEYYDMRTDVVNKKVLLYSGPRWLCEDAQKKLVDFMKNGGTLICFQSWPVLNEKFESCNLLDIPEPSGILPHINASVNFNGKDFDVSSTLLWWEDMDGSPIKAVRIKSDFLCDEDKNHKNIDAGDSWNIGFIKNVDNGKLVVLGVKPNVQMIHALNEYLGITPVAQTSSCKITTTVLKNKENDNLFLFVMNEDGTDKTAPVKLSYQQLIFNKAIALYSEKELEITNNTVYVPVAAHSAEIVELKIK